MRTEDINALLVKVRDGQGLRQAVEESGLHVRNTLTFLRDSPHREEFKEAKLEATKR